MKSTHHILPSTITGSWKELYTIYTNCSFQNIDIYKKNFLISIPMKMAIQISKSLSIKLYEMHEKDFYNFLFHLLPSWK